jgi:hypothetical protein
MQGRPQRKASLPSDGGAAGLGLARAGAKVCRPEGAKAVEVQSWEGDEASPEDVLWNVRRRDYIVQPRMMMFFGIKGRGSSR